MTYKVPAVETPEFTIYTQDALGVRWIHCDVRKWSAAVGKATRKAFDALCKSGPVYAINEPHLDKTHIHFMEFHGMRFFKELPTIDGGVCHVYVRG